ncbi:hypothetical protein [Alysiella crassa]|uniref:hypothetical protein n=1 Tax=Alysiella crassa TaxID=153491 RepID=UPI0012EBC698|nr:hypothetical protein [Alysiella crassa]
MYQPFYSLSLWERAGEREKSLSIANFTLSHKERGLNCGTSQILLHISGSLKRV